MKEIYFYTNVGGAIKHIHEYDYFYDNINGEYVQKPFQEILEKWDLIEKSIDLIYMLYPIVLWKELSLKYPEIKFVLIDNSLISQKCCCPPYGTATTVIKNPKTKKFIVLSWCDQNRYITNDVIPKESPLYVEGFSSWELENCVDFFAFAGVHSDTVKYEPMLNYSWMPSISGKTYSCAMPIPSYNYFALQHIERLHTNKNRIIPEKLFIDCVVGGTIFRNFYLPTDNRFEITLNQVIPQLKFIEKLSQYSIIMDVNSVAEVSTRTFEGLGLGCAVIRPKLLIQYYNKLIPNYHYAAVDCDDLSDYKNLADSYIKKFEELKENPQLIEFYSKNGRKWYEENCPLDVWTKTFVDKLIDLDKLL